MAGRPRLLLLSTSRSDYGGLLAVLQAASQSNLPLTARLARYRGLAELKVQLWDYQPDVLLILGDRFELLQAVAHLVLEELPLAHLHGGEETLGAVDDQVRHALTKLCHLHFVAHPEYARRVRQMGEEEWRVHLVGAPVLDLLEAAIPSGSVPVGEYLLVLYNPVTRELQAQFAQLEELAAALKELALPVLAIGPNQDPGADGVAAFWEGQRRVNPQLRYQASAQVGEFWELLGGALCLVGNSSAGFIEAPSLGVPVVNIGTRQAGRVRPANVIDVGHPAPEIVAGVRQALRPGFRESLAGLPNPLWQGGAAPRILAALAETLASRSRSEILRKHFMLR